MKKVQTVKTEKGASLSARLFRRGTYSAALAVVAVALAVALSLLFSLLPEDRQRLDMTGDKLYHLGDTTRGVLESLTEDVTLTVITEAGTLDPRVERLLGEYAAASRHIRIAHLDPVVNPSVLTEYGVEADTIVVQAAGGKAVPVLLGNFIGYDQNSYYSYGQLVETEFDGEGQLTSAIHAATNTTHEKVYLLSGHGERALASAVAGRIDKLGFQTESLNLLTAGALPQDCRLVLVYAPSGDLADDELALLREYLAGGGGLFFIGGYADVQLPNFDALLLDYGFQRAPGYIADLQNFYQNNYYNIFPLLDVDRPPVYGLSADAQVLVYDALGYTLADPARETIGCEAFMTTGERGYAVTADGETQGVYILGGYASEKTPDGEARLALLSAPTMIEEELLTSFSSLSNADVFMSVLTWFYDGVEDVSVPAKSLAVARNTVNGGGFYAALFIAILPAAALAGGLAVWLRRRKA